mgnify:CR=1 FL=1
MGVLFDRLSPFDFHAYFAHVGQDAGFDQPYFHPCCGKVVQNQRGNVFGQGFEQMETAGFQAVADGFADFSVVDGAADVVIVGALTQIGRASCRERV